MLLSGKRLFIVEDNPENLMIMRILLEQHGARVESISWAIDVIERLTIFGRVDAILLDLMLDDGRTGFEVFEAIRRLPMYRQVPVVAVSAAELAVALPKVRGKGFQGFIPKPVDFDRFPAQIRQALDTGEIWVTGYSA
jgi:CheY-like chemotaxis protein